VQPYELQTVPDRRALHRPNFFLQARSGGVEQVLKYVVHTIRYVGGRETLAPGSYRGPLSEAVVPHPRESRLMISQDSLGYCGASGRCDEVWVVCEDQIGQTSPIISFCLDKLHA